VGGLLYDLRWRESRYLTSGGTAQSERFNQDLICPDREGALLDAIFAYDLTNEAFQRDKAPSAWHPDATTANGKTYDMTNEMINAA
jgi:hypothetical protein